MANIISVVMTGNVSPLTAALAQGAAQLGRFGGEAQRLGQHAQAAATQANRLGSQSEAASGRVARLGAQADVAAASAARLRAQAEAGGAGAARLGQQAAAAAERAAQLRDRAAQAGAEAARLGAESRLAAAEAARLGSEAEAAGRRAQRMQLGLQAAVAGAGLLAVGLGAAITSAVSFEAAMRQVASIDESVRDNFEEMSSAVLELAKDLPQSANVLAAGLYNIAGSGFYGAEALSILEISAKAAAAGMTTTDNSAKAIVATLNAYGLEASEAGRVSDALFNTVNYGVLSYEELTAAVAHFIGNSAAAGVSIEQAGAALATMTLSGLSASEAGVSLNNMLSKLIKPTGALEKATKDLGISLADDLKNPAIGLHGVMMQLMDASQGNLKTLLDWFSEIRATRGALALMSAEGENYRRVFQGMGTEQANLAATQKAYNEVAKSTAHQFEVLTGSIQSTAIELGLKFLPYVNQAIEFLMNLGGAVSDIAGEVAGGLSSGFADWGGAIRDVGSALDDLNVDELVGLVARIGISALVGGFNLLATAVSATTGFLASNTLAVQGLVAAWLLFKAAAIVHGIQLIATTIALTLVSGVAAAIRGIDLLVARLVLLGGGSLWRGIAMGAASFLAILAPIILVTNALGDMKQAKEEVANTRLRIEEILGSAPGGAAAAVRQVADEMSNLGEETTRSFAQAREEIGKLTAEAEAGLARAQEALSNKTNAKFWTADFWKVWEDAGVAVDKYETQLADLEAAERQLADTQAYMAANVTELANTYGISEAAVVSLAEKHDVDLSQALDAAGESGATLREGFLLLANEMTGAGLTMERTEEAGRLLAVAVDGADDAVKELNATLSLLAGTGLAAQAAIDQMEAGFLDLAEGVGLTGDSLTGFDRVAIANRETMRGQAESILAAAEAHTRMTGSVDEGLAMWETELGRMREVWLAAGRSADEFDRWAESINVIERLGGVDVPVTTPGLPEATTAMERWQELTGLVPADVSTQFSTPGLPEGITDAQMYDLQLDGLAPQVTTTFTMPGLDSGISNSQLYDLQLDGLVPSVTTTFATPGLPPALTNSQLYDLQLDGLLPDVNTQFSTPGLSEAINDANELARAIGAIDREVWVTLNVTQRTAAVQLMSTVGRLPGNAAGGPIRGPGSGTSDDVPIMASNGEWVIRAAAAQMYGRQAMAAVNAGRALVVPMLARGGPVGRYAAGGQVAATGTSGTSGTSGAIELVEKGGQTLAEVYSQTAVGVGETTDALRDVVPRLWEADRNTGLLAATTGLADLTTGRWRENLAGAGEDLALTTLATQTQTLATQGQTLADTENLLGMQLTGVERDLNINERDPVELLNTQAQTLATQEGTLADTEHLAGMLLTGVETDLNTAERMPAVLLGTQTQTLATQESTLVEAEHLTGLTLLGVQWDLASGVQLPTLTAATDLQTVSTTLGTAATAELTGALVEETAASGQTTAALGTQTAATDTATASMNTATGAAGTLTGALGTVTAALGAAAGAADAYAASLNAIPTSVTTTVTTNFVTVGAPAALPAPGGFARGGLVTGPGTGTSDSILAAVSAGEWVIRAQAAARQGPYLMSMLNSGQADVVPRFATGGPVGFASGGVVRPASYRPVALSSTTVVNVGDTTVTVNTAGGDPQAVGRAVRTEIDAALSDVVRLVRAGTGRR